jgi:hypothetical protein
MLCTDMTLTQLLSGHDSTRFPRQTRAAGRGVRALARSPRTKADPDHASDQKPTAKYGTNKIEVVAGTVWQAPPHDRNQVERFGDVGKDHHGQKNEAQ